MNISKREIEVLRALAKEYMQIASLPIQREKMQLWKGLNRHDTVRPLITIEQLPWHELNYDGSLTCEVTTEPFKSMELRMRQIIYKWKHFPVDMVVEPYLTVPFCASNSGYGISVKQEIVAMDKSNSIVSHAFENQFETEEDLEKIKDMVITFDEEKSKQWKECAEYIFDGIIPVYQAGGVNVRLAIWDVIAELMNVENIYYALVDEPEYIHKIMDRMTNSALAGIDQCNKLGLFDTSQNECHCSHIYTDELLSDFHGGISNDSYHSWSCAMAQVFTSTSPSITKEFEIDYISKISSKFGMFYYGCCERLDDRLDIVQKLPNVKKISCSPWSDVNQFAERVNKNIVMSAKPSPAYLAGSILEVDAIDESLNKICAAAKSNGVQAELLLKDISTVQYKPERLTEWANIAMKIANKY